MVSRILQWIFVSTSMKRPFILSGLIFIANAIAIIIAGILDGSLFLPGDDRGVLEHPGAWAIVVGDLLLIPSIYSLVTAVTKIQKKFPIKSSILARKYLACSKNRLIQALLLKRKESRIYLLITAFALLFWTNNAIQTTDPLHYYRHNLFDSVDYIHGYVVMRIVLFISWVVVMPYAVHVSLCVCVSIFNMFRSLERRKMVYFEPFHPDDCGGFSFLGSINVLLIASVLVVYLELIVVLFTHQHINPGLLSGFVLATVAFLFFSFFMLVPVHRFLLGERKRIGLRWYREQRQRNGATSLLQLLYIKSQVSFSPYTAQQKVAVFVARGVPVVISISKYLFQMT